MIATVTLNPSIDQHLEVEKLVKHDANRASSVTYHAGGKGVNVSKVVRELGGPTRAYTIVAGFVGDFWNELVEEIDVPHWSMRVEGQTRVNTVITDRLDRTQTRISAPGPCAKPAEITRFLKKLLAVRPKPFIWVFGGSLPRGMNASTNRRFIEALQANGTPCVLDADDEALRQGLKAKPFLIKPNEFEMRRLTRRRLDTVPEYLDAARRVVDSGVKYVVVSLAARGALFVSAHEAFLVPTVSVRVRSRVGAGDSLIGGLATGLLRGRPFREAAVLGIAASTSAVMREAPRLCVNEDIPGLVRRLRPRAL